MNVNQSYAKTARVWDILWKNVGKREMRLLKAKFHLKSNEWSKPPKLATLRVCN